MLATGVMKPDLEFNSSKGETSQAEERVTTAMTSLEPMSEHHQASSVNSNSSPLPSLSASSKVDPQEQEQHLELESDDQQPIIVYERSENEEEMYQQLVAEMKERGLDPVSLAIIDGVMPIVDFKQLIRQHEEDINEGDDHFEFAPIHIAVIARRADYLAELLTLKTIDVNAVAKENTTALIYAVDFGYIEIVQLLMEHEDIDINIADTDSNTAVSFALDRWRIDVFNVLMSRNHQISEAKGVQSYFYKLNFYKLCDASAEEALEVAATLRAHGANFNKLYDELSGLNTDRLVSGGTIEQAVFYGNAELVDYYLSAFEDDLQSKHLEQLWLLNVKTMCAKMQAAKKFTKNSDDYINGNKTSEVLMKHIRSYEEKTDTKVPLCTRVVGDRNF